MTSSFEGTNPKTIMSVILTILVTCLSYGVICVNTETLKSFKHAKVITSEQLMELKMSPAVSVVYFYTNDVTSIKMFYEEYDKSAKYMEAYNVKLNVFDCTASDTFKEDMCHKEGVERNVYTYQKGVELLTLEVDTMFDVNSIMSNILQLVLLHDVPIISSRLEKYELEKEMAGKQDLILTYVQAVGTPEHRIYMEIAYTFQDRYKFALTTDFKTVAGLQDSEILKSNDGLAMWVMLCSEASPETLSTNGDCRNILYRMPVTLSAMATYVSRLADKTLYIATEDGVTEMFELKALVPVIYVFRNEATKEDADAVIDLLSHDLRGVAKVVVVDMENEECQKAAKSQGLEGLLPALSIKSMEDIIIFFQSKEWTLENIQNFLVSYVFPDGGLDSEEPPEQVGATELETQDDLSLLIAEVETQDDQVAEAVFQLQKKNIPLTHVTALNRTSFYNTVKTEDLMFVLFYLPFDSVSMAFLRDYDEAADILASNYSQPRGLARVNCFDASDLCSAENITTYPLLRIYQKGEDTRKYVGPLGSAAVLAAFKLLQLRSPFKLKSEEDVEDFLSGKFPNDHSMFTSASVLLVASKPYKELFQTYREVSKSLSTITPLAYVLGDVASSVSEKYNVPVPSIIAWNRQDSIKPLRKLTSDFTSDNIKEFVKFSTLSSLPELTVESFPLLYSQKLPLTILFVDQSHPEMKGAMDVLTSLLKSSKFPQTILCWMNAESKSLGQKILSEYTWTATLPIIAVVNHKQAEVFINQDDVLNLDALSAWLARVLNGQETPSKKLHDKKWGPPKRHYDFLAMIDQQQGHQGEDTQIDYDADHSDDKSLESDPNQPNSIKFTPAKDELLEVDSVVREELLALHKSRIYHHSTERREGSRKRLRDQETVVAHDTSGTVFQGHEPKHVEL